jgi:hypothetical protein
MRVATGSAESQAVRAMTSEPRHDSQQSYLDDVAVGFDVFGATVIADM